MAEPAFDTLTIARELERDFGFEPKQAEGTATMMHRHLVGNVATKEDLQALDEKIDSSVKALKIDIKALDEKLTDKIEALEERVILKMTVRLGGIMVAIFAFFEVLNRVFPIAGG